MLNCEKVWSHQFVLFKYPEFEIDGTSNEEGCDLFIYDTQREFTLNLRYDDNIISLFNEDTKELIENFKFCENFEQKAYEIYQRVIKK